ncbi:MAG: TetR/AcrR family transcriptional regulator [Pseudomonadota bacterium]
MSLREKAKKDKLKRIREAARHIFEEKGFEAATTREIADRAEVAVGTLFVYAPAKRDLLLMVYNDDLETLASNIDGDAPLIEQLTALFEARFEFWGRNPELSRFVVREVFDPINADEAAAAQTLRFRRRRAMVVQEVAEIVAARQTAGEVDAGLDPTMIAQMLYSIFLSENRQWLEAPSPDVAEGVAKLRALFELALSGVYT